MNSQGLGFEAYNLEVFKTNNEDLQSSSNIEYSFFFDFVEKDFSKTVPMCLEYLECYSIQVMIGSSPSVESAWFTSAISWKVTETDTGQSFAIAQSFNLEADELCLIPCDPGFAYDLLTQNCVICQEGSYSGSGMFCVPCAQNHYSDVEGSTECTPCSDNLMTLSTGSISDEECVKQVCYSATLAGFAGKMFSTE